MADGKTSTPFTPTPGGFTKQPAPTRAASAAPVNFGFKQPVGQGPMYGGIVPMMQQAQAFNQAKAAQAGGPPLSMPTRPVGLEPGQGAGPQFGGALAQARGMPTQAPMDPATRARLAQALAARTAATPDYSAGTPPRIPTTMPIR